MSGCFCTGACKTGGGCAARDSELKVGRAYPSTTAWPEKFPSTNPWPKIEDIPQIKHPSIFDMPAKEAPGFHPVDAHKQCMAADHNFPSMLYVPPGMKYVHYCPSCGLKTTVIGNTVTC